MAALCDCGAKRGHSVHIKALGLAGYHEYRDPSKAGLKAVSDGRAAYVRSQEHKDAYEALKTAHCVAAEYGAPGTCYGPQTPHHTFTRSKAGDLAKAEDEFPVVWMCASHNAAIQADHETREWAKRTYLTVGNRQTPFLVSDEFLTAERERGVAL